MKVVFVSNYFNHHQKPFCEEMYKRLGDDFSFISTSTMREERKKLGYLEESNSPYVHLEYKGQAEHQKALDLINNADVVIAGSTPNDLIKDRIKANKLILRYSERPFRKKMNALKRFYYWMNFNNNNMWKNNIYMLCAGAYVSSDYKMIGLYDNHAYKWGYFPDMKKYDIDLLLAKKNQNTIMWCGRFIKLKNPNDVIMLAKLLRDEGYDFQLKFVGTGIMEDELKELVKKYDLSRHVHFLGTMTTEQVRSHMETAGIYLFTSNKEEGWGAVLNEAMNSGCAVVASHAIGSVPYLVRNGKNGIIYESNNLNELFENVKFLLDNSKEQVRLGKAAYKTITTEWNPKIATDRLISLLEMLLSGIEHPDLYEDGPCSKAEIVYDDW